MMEQILKQELEDAQKLLISANGHLKTLWHEHKIHTQDAIFRDMDRMISTLGYILDRLKGGIK